MTSRLYLSIITFGYIIAATYIWKRQGLRRIKNRNRFLLLMRLIFLFMGLFSLHTQSSLIVTQLAPLFFMACYCGTFTRPKLLLSTYWRDLAFLLSLVMIPLFRDILLEVRLLPIITAKLTMLFFGLISIDAHSTGAFVVLPSGSVEITNLCSGPVLMANLLGITILFLYIRCLSINALMPALGGALLIGYLVNLARLIITSYIVAFHYSTWFHFWHGSWGRSIFNCVGLLCLSLFLANLEKRLIFQNRQRITASEHQ